MYISLFVKCYYGNRRVCTIIGWQGVPRIGEHVIGDDGAKYKVEDVTWNPPKEHGGQSVLVVLCNKDSVWKAMAERG